MVRVIIAGILITFIVFGVFIGVITVFVVIVVKLVRNSSNNNKSPILMADATVVGKRANIHNDHTWYYITYQVENGYRMEFNVIDTEFGIIAEGDRGKLTFQNDRYLGFERYINQG